MKCFDDLLARLLFLIGRNGIFKIKKDYVCVTFRRFLHKTRVAAGNCLLSSIEAGRALAYDRMTHDLLLSKHLFSF
jgi:hypothetical protein